ncbi:hypothetical protein GGI06_004992, partial [Coemansia sp. S85]
KKEVLPTSYHGVYQGVPLVDEVIPVTWKPWESDSVAANDTSSGSRAKVVVDQPPPEPAPVATRSDKAPDTASGTAKKSQQEPKPTRKKASAARAQSSASSRSRKRNSIAPSTQPTRRPLTSVQDAHAKHYTEWRDIHVQSLSRVDSILREAVGLRASGPSRWSACATSAFGGQGDPARALPRPNTSSSYLSTSVSRPSLLGNNRRSGESEVSGTDDASTARPVRAHTASSLDRPHSEARGESMYLPNQVPRPATTHSNRRQMSMYNPSIRQLRLSRDEARRSRLFAEYEKLMGSKDSGEENDEGEDEDDVVTTDDIDEDAVLVGLPMEGGQGSLDDISEEAEYEFANYEPSSVDDVVTGGPFSEEAAAPPQQTSLVDKRKPIYAARPRPATVFGLSGPTLREARNNQATSLYSSGDMLSRKQTAKRWSRTLIQNQHLFRAQTIADQLDLESTFGDGDDVDEAASSHEASSPPQPLQLDLPPDVDLYQD